MSLVQKICDDLLTARKNRDTRRSGYLSTLLGDLEAIGKNSLLEITDAEVIAVLKKYIKNTEITQEALLASAQDVDDKLTYNLSEQLIYQSYLPKQLTEDELRTIIGKYTHPTTVGLVMGELKKNYAGLYDGAMVRWCNGK